MCSSPEIDITIDSESLSIAEWKQKIGLIPAVYESGLLISRDLIDSDSNIGFQWEITINARQR